MNQWIVCICSGRSRCRPLALLQATRSPFIKKKQNNDTRWLWRSRNTETLTSEANRCHSYNLEPNNSNRRRHREITIVDMIRRLPPDHGYCKWHGFSLPVQPLTTVSCTNCCCSKCVEPSSCLGLQLCTRSKDDMLTLPQQFEGNFLADLAKLIGIVHA